MKQKAKNGLLSIVNSVVMHVHRSHRSHFKTKQLSVGECGKYVWPQVKYQWGTISAIFYLNHNLSICRIKEKQKYLLLHHISTKGS